MLKRLRIKFIALNMATVAVVLAAVFSAICFISYQQNVAAVYAALGTAIDHADGAARQAGDRMGSAGRSGPRGAGESSGSDAAEDATDAEQSASPLEGAVVADSSEGASPEGRDFTPPTIGGNPGGQGAHIPVAVYVVDSAGEAFSVDTIASASIDSEVLSQAIAELASAPDGSGELGGLGLLYEKRSSDDGVSRVAFADVSSASGWQSLALTLTGVGVAALAVFFVISLLFSRWALRPVREAWTRQRQFVADASHELKTPLTVILANSSILLSHPERSVASQSQWVESTQAEGERMQELVGDLLLLARMDAEAGDAVPARAAERVDFSNLVEGELLQFESVAFDRGITLSSNVEAGLAVRGVPERLRRLATTLLDNACKYVNPGGSVRVELRREGKSARLAVHNTGPAIPAADLPHVFDRFYRADKARTQGVGGYGLGLSIAREVVEEHGGAIRAKSSEEEGASFAVTLPLAP